MPTILDVAKTAGVSTATVSRVINNHSYVHKDTKEKILNTIRELNYSPSYLAQRMRAQKTKSFAVLIPDFTNIYYSQLLNSVEMEARKNGYLSVVCTTEIDFEREKEYIYDLIKRQVDGIILCWYRGVEENKTFLKEIIKKVAVLIMDQPAHGLPISSVYADGYTGIKQIINYLVQKGHRRIALIRSLSRNSSTENRVNGYIAGMRENHINFSDDWITESDYTIEGGYEGAKRILNEDRFTAIVAVDDLMAIGAMQFVKECGYSIPGDISITGFDDIPLASLVTPKLTTLAQPVQKIALSATRLLIKKMENRKSKSREVVYPPTLVVRESA